MDDLLPEVLEPRNAGKFAGVTLGEYLEKEKYSKFFADNYVVRRRGFGGFWFGRFVSVRCSVGLRVFFRRGVLCVRLLAC